MDAGQEVATATFGNEDRLPRVPLPTLEETCEKFVAWCAPLLTAAELAATKIAVASFLRPESPARTLQAALEEYDAGDGVQSWLDAFWSHRYLGRRDRIALNANFFYLFRDSDQGQVERAAGLIAGVVDYKLLLDAERLPPVVRHGRALSMEQNRFLFSATRIPGSLQDTVRTPYSEGWPGPSRERHIVVFFRGRMFRMDVIGVHCSTGIPAMRKRLTQSRPRSSAFAWRRPRPGTLSTRASSCSTATAAIGGSTRRFP